MADKKQPEAPAATAAPKIVWVFTLEEGIAGLKDINMNDVGGVAPIHTILFADETNPAISHDGTTPLFRPKSGLIDPQEIDMIVRGYVVPPQPAPPVEDEPEDEPKKTKKKKSQSKSKKAK
jgi:hypothetical protein